MHVSSLWGCSSYCPHWRSFTSSQAR
jgi:hypothetical protein